MRLALCLAAFALPSFAHAGEAVSVHYRCDDGARLPVAYVNTPAGESYAVLVHDGKLDILKAGMAASGVRYVSIDGSDLVWHVKGNEGFLAQDDAGEPMILAGCKAR